MCSPTYHPTDHLDYISHQQDIKHKATHPPLPKSAERFDKGGVLGFKGSPKPYFRRDPRGGKVLV